MAYLQKSIISVGFVWIVVLCLFPPCHIARDSYSSEDFEKQASYLRPDFHHLIWSFPERSISNWGTSFESFEHQIDVLRLGIYILIGVVVSLFGFLVWKPKQYALPSDWDFDQFFKDIEQALQQRVLAGRKLLPLTDTQTEQLLAALDEAFVASVLQDGDSLRKAQKRAAKILRAARLK